VGSIAERKGWAEAKAEGEAVGVPSTLT
jgi:hypothetical protein